MARIKIYIQKNPFVQGSRLATSRRMIGFIFGSSWFETATLSLPHHERRQINLNKAFTLIELLIYIASFAFFSILVFGFLIQTQNKIFFDSAQNEKLIRNNISLDLLKRDLICASANKFDWDVQNFVFRKTVLDKNGIACSICISRKLQNDALIRTEGEYNFVTKAWKNKISSRVQNDLKYFDFSLQESEDKKYIKKVELRFEKDKQISILLRNGRVG